MIFDLTPIRPIHNDAVPDTHFFSQNTVYNMCVSCPPFFKAPRFALRGGWDKYVSPAPQAEMPHPTIKVTLHHTSNVR